jgi:hypothetical protein
MILLRLPAEVLPVFRERIAETLPAARVARIERAIRELRGGKMNESAFHARQRGQGERWQAIQTLFDATRRRLGFTGFDDHRAETTFRRPTAQLGLWPG